MSWSKASHGNDVAPNYNVVFPKNTVNTLTITIAPGDWAVMQADLEELFAESLWVRTAIIAAGPGLSLDKRRELMNQLFASKAQDKATRPEADPQPAKDRSSRSPMWVPATITFQGREWEHVGVRHKGDFSLRQPWMLGEQRLPFKFDFDQFEDDHPKIKNQRFFGFKELSLANNYGDPAGMRDLLVYELLAEAGLPSLRAAPYEIMLDCGEGPERLGLYTMVEVVDDTGVTSFFGCDDGNLYEAEGAGASLAVKDADKIAASFQKKNNAKQGDWSDIRALYDVLHSPRRTGATADWRADLEAIFDVDGFLEWLGIAGFVGHVDTYGLTPHNFYVYHNPATGRLTWFSWDHNMTFGEEARSVFNLDRAYVPDAWPLIRFLLDDPVYRERYVQLLKENASTVLAPDALTAKIRAHTQVIAPVATRDMRREEYDAAVQALLDYVALRGGDVQEFLATQK
jgi:hypothetical protein